MTGSPGSSRTDLASLIGVPYRLGGATRAGADCWGLVVLAYRELGIELPAYNAELASCGGVPDGLVRSRAGTEADRAWSPVAASAARCLDVVLISMLSRSDHVAIVMGDPRWLLTTNAQIGAHRVRWGRGSGWQGRIRGVWRHAASGGILRAPGA